jgi:hypothetical protein
MPADLRYPIGPFEDITPITPAKHEAALGDIAALPAHIRAAVRGLTDAQLDTRYRPDGWTVRQVVHHVADSHMHSLIRVKLTLTEDTPTIKPYDEAAHATLGDMQLPVDVSLRILDGLHTRWTAVYRHMTTEQWSRAFVHPERGETMSLSAHLQIYAWHSRHHVAHITELRRREGWVGQR